MISHSNKFKKAFTDLGRELYVKILHYAVVYNLETEDEKLILTQNNLELLTEDMESLTPVSELGNDDIISLNKNNLGELFRTYMKSFDLETTHRFNVGDKMIINIGCKVDDDIEYLNYGKYYVYAKAYNEDTKTFTYTLCDKMLFTMIPYDNSAVFENNDTMTCQAVINQILTLCNIPYGLNILINGSKVIYKETFDGLELTYRDVLDMIMQTQGCSLVVDYDAENDIDRIIDKSFNSSVVDTIDENILSDKNIKVKEKFGKINSLLFKRASGIDNIERKDQEAINRDGLCQYSIEDNLILDQENRADYIDNLFNKIRNIEYYECEIDTIGIGYIEYLDLFELRTPDSIYKCLCLKNTAQVSNGYKESFTTEAPVDTTQEYVSGAKDDKTASILMDKLKGEIVLKTDSNGKITQVRLDSSPEDGSVIEIGADNIKLEGTTTINERFKIDTNGYMHAKAGGDISGWKITNSALYKDVRIGDYDYRVYIQSPLQNYTEDSWIFSTQKKHKNDSGYTGTSVIKLGGDISGKSITTNGHTVAWTSNVNGFYGAPSAGYMLISIDGYSGQYGIDIWASDKRLKRNIKRTNVKALDIINKIPHKEFIYNDDKEEKIIKIGYIADDLKDIDEQMIYEVGDEKMKHPNVRYIVPLLSKAIQEQQEQIEELKKEIENLKGGNK